MEARELRIGNWVHVSDDGHGNAYDEQCTASHIDYLANGGANIDPIPLTEEWLEKFGFEYDGDGIFYLHRNESLVYDIRDSMLAINDEWLSYATFKHVHQLQNLYFALIGEDL